MPVDIQATIRLMHNMSWGDFKKEAEESGIPDYAVMDSYSYQPGGIDAMRESPYTDIKFKWQHKKFVDDERGSHS